MSDNKQKAYELRKSGLTWKLVAEKIGVKSAGAASGAAYNYSAKHGLDFPPKAIDHRLRR